jgi:hypothetical protein
MFLFSWKGINKLGVVKQIELFIPVLQIRIGVNADPDPDTAFYLITDLDHGS